MEDIAMSEGSVLFFPKRTQGAFYAFFALSCGQDFQSRLFFRKKVSYMFAHLDIIRAYLSNIQALSTPSQQQYVERLLQHVQELLPSSIPHHDSPVHLTIGVGLDAGKKRKHTPNEDALFAASDVLLTGDSYGLFVVADGMGGHANGQEASQQAIQCIVDEVLPALSRQKPQADALLVAAVRKANALLYQQNEQESLSLQRMGTTVTAALIINTTLTVANVGDSRAYLYRPEAGLIQLTRDHSVVQEKIAMGLIRPEDIYTDPDRNKITRCVGTDQRLNVDVFSEQLGDRDVLLLCSDGLWEMTRDQQIQAILQTDYLTAPQMARQLIDLAESGGGRDNIAVLVGQVSLDVATCPTRLIPSPLTATLPIPACL